MTQPRSTLVSLDTTPRYHVFRAVSVTCISAAWFINGSAS